MQDPKKDTKLSFWFWLRDIAPVYFTESFMDTTLKTVTYNWNKDGISGADSVKGNLRKKFYLKFDSPNLNWNLSNDEYFAMKAPIL